MINLVRRLLITFLGAVLVMGLAVAPAVAASGGQVAVIGSHGTGSGKFAEPIELGVDITDNSVFVLDSLPTGYRLLKMSSAGSQEGSAEIPFLIGPGEEELRVTGLAVDSEKERVYILGSLGADTHASEIYVFSTTPNNHEELVSPIGGSGTLSIPAGAKPLNNPFAIALDPSTHDLVVAGRTGTSGANPGEVVIQKITESGAAGPRFTVAASGFGSFAPDSLAVANDGTTFIGTAGDTFRLFELPAAWTSAGPLTEVTSPSVARKTESWPGQQVPLPPAFGEAFPGNPFGPQLAVSPDGGTIYLMQALAIQSEQTNEPGSFLLRSFSLQTGKTTALYGDGGASCQIGTKFADVALGSNGSIFVLEHLNEFEGSFGGRVVEFGPTGSGCPAPGASFTVNGSSSAATNVQKGQTVSLLAYGGASELSSKLHGAYPTALTWTVTGPEPFTVPAVAPAGSPIPLELQHKFLKGGTYTVKLEVETGFLVGGNSASASKTITVGAVAPTALFQASTLTPIVGEAVTFNASGSTDGIGGALTEAKYIWDFGDGSSEETRVPTTSHAYSSPGGRTVRLIVENEGLKSASAWEEALTVSAPSSGGGGGGGGSTGGGSSSGGGSTSTPVPTPTLPGKPKPTPAKPKSPLQTALAKCTKKKGKAKAQCVKAAKKKFAKKPKAKGKKH
jgi:hypothetical protein